MGDKKFLAWLGLFFFLFTVCLMTVSGVSAAEKKEILVGAVNSLTGVNAMTAAECKWAYEQAIADVNKKGGVFVKELNKKLPIKLIFADDKSTPGWGSGGYGKTHQGQQDRLGPLQQYYSHQYCCGHHL